MGIKWQDYITNNKVLERANFSSMKAILMFHQLCWVGHVSHMDDSRMPKAMLYSELSQGKHDRGPYKQFKDQLKHQLTLVSIGYQSWEQKEDNRESCHSTSRNRADFEASRRKAVDEKQR